MSTDQTTSSAGRTAETDEEDDAKPAVVFLTKPKIHVDENGITVKVALVNRGGASVNVSFRVSYRGGEVTFDSPTLALSAKNGTKSVDLSLPLDSGITEGAKIKVAAIGEGGESLAVSSTGVVSFNAPGLGHVSLGKTGVAVVAVATLGIVSVALPPIIEWFRGEPDSEGAEPPAEPEPSSDEEPPDEPPAAENAPLVIPDAVTARLRTIGYLDDGQSVTEDNDDADDTTSLVVDFVGLDDSGGVNDVEIVVFYGARSASLGRHELPATLPVDTLVDPIVITDSGVSLHAVDDPTLLRCIDRDVPETDVENHVRGHYVASVDGGPLSLTLTPQRTDSGAYSLSVAAQYQTEIRLRLDDGEVADRCAATSHWILDWESSGVSSNGSASGAEDSDDVQGADSEGGVGDVSGIDDDVNDDDSDTGDDGGDAGDGGGVSQLEYVEEPETGALELGDRGPRVSALQAALIDLEFLAGQPDGEFGPATEAALRAFQEAAELQPDGIAGPQTHERLAIPYSPLDDVQESADTPLREGDSGARVSALQTALIERGFLDDEADGEFGPATKAALIDFQDAVGLDADGIAGPATHEALSLPYD